MKYFCMQTFSKRSELWPETSNRTDPEPAILLLVAKQHNVGSGVLYF